MNLTWLYIAALFAIAVYFVRDVVRWRIAFVFYAIVLVTFFRALTGPYINFAADVIEMIPPWSAHAPLKLLIALTFTFLYLRKRGASEIASVAGSISFALSTYVIGWLHYAHATVAVFTPAIFYAIDLIAERVSAKRIAFASIVAAMMVFGGHVESVIYVGVMAVVYVIWIAAEG